MAQLHPQEDAFMLPPYGAQPVPPANDNVDIRRYGARGSVDVELAAVTFAPLESLPVDGSRLIYDPPNGWKYGFPKPYEPRNGESLADTLVRDGYPRQMAEDFGVKHCRFWGAHDRD